jgi:polyhydroxyalkanoate synthesis regulator phasin
VSQALLNIIQELRDRVAALEAQVKELQEKLNGRPRQANRRD